MPKIFEYLGIAIYFWSKEHEPIHVHGQYQKNESKAEIALSNGKVSSIVIKPVAGHRPLEEAQMADFEVFVNAMALQIAEKWVDYFVYHRKVSCERITKKVK